MREEGEEKRETNCKAHAALHVYIFLYPNIVWQSSSVQAASARLSDPWKLHHVPEKGSLHCTWLLCRGSCQLH